MDRDDITRLGQVGGPLDRPKRRGRRSWMRIFPICGYVDFRGPNRNRKPDYADKDDCSFLHFVLLSCSVNTPDDKSPSRRMSSCEKKRF
jgi:membrane-associated protease RseP (regulator of RpoE activity)